MNLPKNTYLHLILVVLIPLTIIKFEYPQQKKTFAELQQQEPYLIPDNIQFSSAQEEQLQTDLYDLRLSAKNSLVQVIHFKPELGMQKAIDYCTALQFNNAYCQRLMQNLIDHPITVKVPSNLRSVTWRQKTFDYCTVQQFNNADCHIFMQDDTDHPITVKALSHLQSITMILHSDVPIHWQFEQDNQRVKALFFTGILPSSIRGSQLSSHAPKFFSFQYHSTCEFGPMCRMTQINFLQKYTTEYQYREKVQLLLDKDVDKFITLIK